ncbi:MAG: DUF5320 domain-containing protein [Anaerolineales bacterium]|jgi:TolA-binding protein
MSHIEDKIRQLEGEIEELKQQWPAHSVSPALLQQLEDLEEQLERLKAQLKQKPPSGGSNSSTSTRDV